MRAFLSKLSAATLGILGLAATAVDSSAQSTTLVGWTNLWAYNDATTPTENLHGTGWQLPGYDTNSAPGWKTGPALFGNDGGGLYDGLGRPFSGGVNGFLTPLNRGIAAASDRVTFYFRKNFTFNGAANSILEAKWVHDDGIVVYINGTEAFRSKMTVAAPDPVNWDTLGANHDAAGFPPVVVEGFEYTQDLDTSLLVQGDNTIAVELHQSSTTSSDVAFALQLSSIVPFAPVFVDANQPTNRTLLQFRGSVLTAEATGRPAPTYQWFVDGSPIDGATSSSLQITNESPDTVTRKYFCRVSNSVGEIDSREASVLFTSDSTPPTVVGVSQAGPFNTVVVNFDEVVEQQTATEPFTYFLNDGNSPLDVVLNPGGTSVTITYQNDMLPGTVYTISIEGVSDLVPNTMVPVEIQFTSWVPTDCGGVLFETFDTSSTAGTAINLLTGHPNYPNNPRETFRMPTFSTRNSYTDDTHEQFGGRMRALFIPPTSGNWVFYLSSDDAGQLFLNPNGPGEGGKIKIQEETGCCNPYSSHASAPYALEAGKAYYLEAIYKEGGGGDYCHVWAGPEGVAPPSAAAASLTPNDAIPGSMLGFPAAPLNAAGTFTITQQPADTSVVPNTVATFSVATSSDAFKCYQWLRDGVEIPNANSSSYSFTAGSGDNGAKFSVRISIIGGNTETSSEATLSVAADTIRPTVVSASTDPAGVNVTVTFSEPMEPPPPSLATTPSTAPTQPLQPSRLPRW
ncbi:MAG: Ig-like domain-containing protein [Verrucomicrobia bacterium]|nr:Ig-like domain-containing protein [Verrucomicrobiota bacterium]